MRILVVCVVSLVLTPACLAADHDRPDLKSLYGARRWFELRDSVAKGTSPLFYQGVVACAFNDLRACEKRLRAAIKFRPQSDEAIEAHRTLTSAYLRQGKYREALAQVDAVLALKPGDSGARNSRPLLASLSEFPDQKVVHRGSTVLRLHDEGVPISINGVAGTFWFDTGASYSIVSESDAKRFGLKVRAMPTKIGVSTGAQIRSRVATAEELSIGSTRLRYVAFLVFPDDQPPFNQAPPGSRGLIGIPVLLGLQRFVWGGDRNFKIGAKSPGRHVPHADLCFDGNLPLAQIQFESHLLAFVLDTGATNTDLFPPFAAEFPELIRTAAKTNSYKMEGVGDARNVEAAILASLHFTIGGFPVVLNPAWVLLKPTGVSSLFFEGNLGIDLLQQAHKTTWDFKAMSLTLQ